MLAAFTAPRQKRPPGRDLDGLKDDVVELSYERALRAHSRFRAHDTGERSLTQVERSLTQVERSLTQVERHAPLRIMEVFPADFKAASEPSPKPAAVLTITEAQPDSQPEPQPEPRFETSTAPALKLKSTRISMSLSTAEHEQLRARAAEAGLTLSAYLRSCTVEAESLRAQVKLTLAELRGEAGNQNYGKQDHESAPANSSWFQRLPFWPRAHGNRRVAQA